MLPRSSPFIHTTIGVILGVQHTEIGTAHPDHAVHTDHAVETFKALLGTIEGSAKRSIGQALPHTQTQAQKQPLANTGTHTPATHLIGV